MVGIFKVLGSADPTSCSEMFTVETFVANKICIYSAFPSLILSAPFDNTIVIYMVTAFFYSEYFGKGFAFY